MKFIDLTGHVFGRLTVQGQGSTKNGRIHWVCICSCGTRKEIASSSLRAALSLSCGCRTVEANISRSVHGMTNSVEHKAWRQMLSRCGSPTNPGYKNYGGRGIKVDPVWAASFSAFFESIGPRPASGYTLERIDTNGNYEPGNVTWATRAEQGRNTRRSKWWVVKGRVFPTSAEAAAFAGVDQSTIVRREQRGDSDLFSIPKYEAI